ncbi:MAG: ABC transporter substrate-binding protein [Pseudonocardiaceae bacterium]|nr:ABC transporter substrate-binding protein [Pseudonocardiaceae bacterium]
MVIATLCRLTSLERERSCDMRRLAVSMFAFMVLLVPACSGTDGPAAPSAPQQLTVGAGEDSYVVEEPEADVGFEPRGIFEGLVQMSPDYEIEPLLATRWELIEPNTWRFHLRDGVTFHDGTPFTAEAVKYTFDRLAEAGGGALHLGPDSTKIVDERTVDVTATVENRRLVEQLVHPSNSIIAPDSKPGEKPVGTGPFRFVEYVPKQRLVVERNGDYWGEQARLQQITFRYIPEANARRLALESGDIDVMLDVPLDAVTSLESSGFVVDRPAPGLYEAMYANISGEAGYTTLQDENVRKAVAYAIDRNELLKGVFDGLGADEQTMVPARLLGSAADTVEGYSHDPERAARLLEQSGWRPGADGIRVKDGKRLSLELVNGFPSSQEHGAVAEFLQAQLREAGIDVKIITTPDSGAYEERLNSSQGDLWLERGNQNDANPAFLPALLFWEEGLFGNIGYQPVFAPGWPPDVAQPRVGDGAFDRTIVEALAAPDSTQVKELTAEAMHLLVDEHAIIVPLAGLVRPLAARSEVKGLPAHPSGIQTRFDDAFVAGG